MKSAGAACIGQLCFVRSGAAAAAEPVRPVLPLGPPPLSAAADRSAVRDKVSPASHGLRRLYPGPGSAHDTAPGAGREGEDEAKQDGEEQDEV